jgi:hypothetical protein
MGRAISNEVLGSLFVGRPSTSTTGKRTLGMNALIERNQNTTIEMHLLGNKKT